MLPLCYSCGRALPGNDVLGQFPIGRRVAYDPARGRLWAICPACARWNLARIEERWEALEELERVTRDRARLLTSTDNIGLLRAGPLDIVRVGPAQLREEAWWRYGRELARRNRRSQGLLALDVALALTMGFPVLRDVVRGLTFAQGAPTGVRRCARCGASLSAGALSLRKAGWLLLETGADGDVRLRLPCPYCAQREEDGGTTWTGTDVGRIARTVLAYQNFEGAAQPTIVEASRRIETVGSPTALVREVAGWHLRLADLRFPVHTTSALALEIAVNEEHERALLAREAVGLEEQWRKEETLAAIVDRELTPLPDVPPAAPGS